MVYGHQELKIDQLKHKLCSYLKEWLFLSFFPQEEPSQLEKLRNKLTPFLKAVSEALSIELEKSQVKDKNQLKEALFDRVLETVPIENVSYFSHYVKEASIVLQNEFNDLQRLNSE